MEGAGFRFDPHPQRFSGVLTRSVASGRQKKSRASCPVCGIVLAALGRRPVFHAAAAPAEAEPANIPLTPGHGCARAECWTDSEPRAFGGEGGATSVHLWRTAHGRCSGTPAGVFGLGWNGRLEAQTGARSKVRRHLREQPPNLSPASQTPRKQEAESGDGRERAASKQTWQRSKQTGGETPAGQEAAQLTAHSPHRAHWLRKTQSVVLGPQGTGETGRDEELVEPRLHRRACSAAPVWRQQQLSWSLAEGLGQQLLVWLPFLGCEW